MTTPESVLEQIALDQRSIAELNNRIAENKRLLDSFLDLGSLEHLLDPDTNCFRYTTITLSRSKRSTIKFNPEVEAEIDALKLNAKTNHLFTETVTHFWTVRAS